MITLRSALKLAAAAVAAALIPWRKPEGRFCKILRGLRREDLAPEPMSLYAVLSERQYCGPNGETMRDIGTTCFVGSEARAAEVFRMIKAGNPGIVTLRRYPDWPAEIAPSSPLRDLLRA